MSVVAKVFVVLNLVLSVAFLVFAMNIWTANTKWQKMYEDERKGNVELKANAQRIQKDLWMKIVFEEGVNSAAKQVNTTLKQDRDRIRDDMQQVAAELATVKNESNMKYAENQELGRDIRRKDEDMVKLKGILIKQQQAVIVERDNATTARREKSDIENDLNATKQTLAALQRDKRNIEEDLGLQTSRIDGLMRKGVPISEILGLDSEATQPLLADAVILHASPDIGLVMITIGSQHGVKPGYRFTVSRDGHYIGKIQIEKVYPDMSSAKLVPGLLNKQGMEIQVNDEVRSR